MAKISTFILLCLVRIHANGYVLPECKINIITRAEWGARPPKAITNLRVPVPEFFVHHTDTPECFDVKACSAAVRSIQDFHMDERGWNDIGYNFLVGEDGNVYEGRGWDHVGAHTKDYNSKSLGTSVIGNYTAKLPNQKALTALKTLIACGVEEKKLIPNYRLYGHRDAGKTSCPGDALYKLIQTWPHYSHEPPKLSLFEKSNNIVYKW
ncbi:peptidoglycan recognition protein 1-like [Mercenaria mercenaria]|uniref:peptidoglycan recognition protein 1-like n=1 Tax=Mercenaria mercenaria TaxID=6596 RepID=UPI00234E3F66|nr:peptidoglycan recognition protein 1-like [Mercenaria mercenaria]